VRNVKSVDVCGSFDDEKFEKCFPHFELIIVCLLTVNNEVLMSPPHNNASLNQRDMLITQPSSIPSSPLASPGALSTSASFCLQSALSSSNINTEGDDPTTDPNWQATKPTVRERNAAMFNNELMADIKFVVGGDGE
jgi:hypothetical protein